MIHKSYFSIDLGATSGRTILAEYDGVEIDMREISRFSNPTIPETKAFCPRGLGMVPYLMPSGLELAEATIRTIDENYDVVMWEKHGVFAVDTDIMAAFDQVDVLNKAALIYIAAKIWVLNRKECQTHRCRN